MADHVPFVDQDISDANRVKADWLNGVNNNAYRANALIAGYSGYRTAQQKFSDTISVKDFGVVGDGVTDDTTALQLAVTSAAGKILDFLGGLTLIISAPITLASNSAYVGTSIIKCKAATLLNGAMLDASNCSGVVIENLTLDGLASSPNGAYYGVQFLNGSGNRIEGCYIHDTLQAGIRAGSESGLRVLGNRLVTCGRNGFTDNHGIMIYSSSATPALNNLVEGNYVDTAYRKGITGFTSSGGAVLGLAIVGNVCVAAGLGNIYLSNAVGQTPQRNVAIVGNVCYNGGTTNIQLANIDSGVVSGNTCDTSAAQNVVMTDVNNLTFTGNMLYKAGTTGLQVSLSAGTALGNTISGNTIRNSNQSSAGSGPGILLADATYTTVVGNSIMGETAAPKMTQAVSETGTADFNVITNNLAAHASSSLYVIVGANTYWEQVVGNKKSVNVLTPNNTLDISGGLSDRPQALTVSTGANDNLALPSNAGTLYVAALGGVFNITGIAGGVPGREITILNQSGQTMTLTHNSTSTAGNRIFVGGGADLAITNYGTATLQWSTSMNGWQVIGYKA